MRIGQLAETAGVGVETVRYYQREGLLRIPDKPAGGVRSYSRSDLNRLRFILRAKTLGFALKDIARLLDLSDADCADVQQLAAEKLEQVRGKMAQLRSMEAALEGTLAQCRERGSARKCPIIESLNEPAS